MFPTQKHTSSAQNTFGRIAKPQIYDLASYTFGSTMVSVSKGEYRYGFNGMEKDNELKGEGNSLDFGARIYDSRLGRWMSVDPLAGIQPGWSVYKFGLNNPIIFIDPEGKTEFYYNSKWIGSDGLNNNLVAKVSEVRLYKAIYKATKRGLFVDNQTINNGAENKNGMLIINKDVLRYSFEMLNLSLTKEGEKGEFGRTLIKEGENYTEVGEIQYKPGGTTNLPENGSVSIHSHPTGIRKNQKGENEYSKANEPSEKDKNAFLNFDTNIIVGLNGGIYYTKDEFGNTSIDKSERYPAINIFDRNTQFLGEVDKSEAENMLSGNRGKLGEKFEIKQKKNEK